MITKSEIIQSFQKVIKKLKKTQKAEFFLTLKCLALIFLKDKVLCASFGDAKAFMIRENEMIELSEKTIKEKNRRIR